MGSVTVRQVKRAHVASGAATGVEKRIDDYEHAIVLVGGEIIRISDILDIDSEVFDGVI